MVSACGTQSALEAHAVAGTECGVRWGGQQHQKSDLHQGGALPREGDTREEERSLYKLVASQERVICGL